MSDIAAAAQALKDRHGGLLALSAWHARPKRSVAAEEAADALDAARERLRGGKRPDAPQLTLDLAGGE